MKYLIYTLITVILILSLTNIIQYNHRKGKVHPTTIVTYDTIERTETVKVDNPPSIVTKWLREEKKAIHHHSTIDSINDINIDNDSITIPISQKEYKDSTYHAWISGYNAQLDSIEVYQKERTITITQTIKEKKKRWSVGVGVGVNYKGQIQPYLGVSYNIFQF